MTETPPPRRALATFLRRNPAREVLSAPSEPGAAPGVAVPAGETEAAAGTPVTPTDPPAAASASKPPSEVTPAEVPAVEVEATASTPVEQVAAPAADAPEAAAPAAPEPDIPAAAWRAAALPIASAAAPTFARTRIQAAVPRTPLWQWGALVVLGVLLVLQILLADRARLAGDPNWRPLLTTLCAALRCDLPIWHEPAAFTMLDRDVRPAPGETGVLRIQASFRNDARWAQAWPWLQLSLSDADGRMIGTRVFAPAEYLGHAPEPGQTLAPGQSGRIDFRVREPAAGTAAFSFDFH